MRDLLGDGIFSADGEKWRHQRKLASHEFSTKVLREFSTSVFRTNSARLATNISAASSSHKQHHFDLQVSVVHNLLCVSLYVN